MYNYKKSTQRPVFDRKHVEKYLKKSGITPRGFRVGYHGTDELKEVDSLDKVDWRRIRRMTILFAEIKWYLEDGSALKRDGVRIT